MGSILVETKNVLFDSELFVPEHSRFVFDNPLEDPPELFVKLNDSLFNIQEEEEGDVYYEIYQEGLYSRDIVFLAEENNSNNSNNILLSCSSLATIDILSESSSLCLSSVLYYIDPTIASVEQIQFEKTTEGAKVAFCELPNLTLPEYSETPGSVSYPFLIKPRTTSIVGQCREVLAFRQSTDSFLKLSVNRDDRTKIELINPTTTIKLEQFSDENIIQFSLLRIDPRNLGPDPYDYNEFDNYIDSPSSSLAISSQSNIDIEGKEFYCIYKKNITENISRGVIQLSLPSKPPSLYPKHNVINYSGKQGIEFAGKNAQFVFQTKNDFPWDSALTIRGKVSLEGGTIEKDVFIGRPSNDTSSGIRIVPECPRENNVDSLVCGREFDPNDPIGRSWGIFGQGDAFFTDIFIGDREGYLSFKKKNENTPSQFILKTNSIFVDTPSFRLNTITTDEENPYISFFQKKTNSPDELPFEFIRLGFLKNEQVGFSSTSIPKFGLFARNSSSKELLRIEEDNSSISGYRFNEWTEHRGFYQITGNFSFSPQTNITLNLPAEGTAIYSKNSILKFGTHLQEHVLYLFSNQQTGVPSGLLSLDDSSATQEKNQVSFILDNRIHHRFPIQASTPPYSLNNPVGLSEIIRFPDINIPAEQNYIFTRNLFSFSENGTRHWIRAKNSNSFRFGTNAAYIGQPSVVQGTVHSHLITVTSVDGLIQGMPNSGSEIEDNKEPYYGVPYIEKSIEDNKIRINVCILKSKTCAKHINNRIRKRIYVLIELRSEYTGLQSIIPYPGSFSIGSPGSVLSRIDLGGNSTIKHNLDNSFDPTNSMFFLGRTNEQGLLEILIEVPETVDIAIISNKIGLSASQWSN